MTRESSWSGNRTAFPSRIRRLILARSGGLCVMCGSPATIADHKVGWPVAQRQGWTVAEYHNPDNGQAMCGTCHDAKTATEQAAGRYMAPRPTQRRKPERHPGLRLPPTNDDSS